jgi:phosphopantetheinyl transferase
LPREAKNGRGVAVVTCQRTDSLDFAALFADWHSSLDDRELRRLASLRHARDRRDYLAAHVLLRLSLAAARGLPVRGSIPLDRAGWSLTHCAGLVAVVVAQDPGAEVGVDAEPLSSRGRLASMPDVFSSAGERRVVDVVDIWTAKEATLKSHGVGIAGPTGSFILRRLECLPATLTSETWRALDVVDLRTSARERAWSMRIDDYSLSVVVNGGDQELQPTRAAAPAGWPS